MGVGQAGTAGQPHIDPVPAGSDRDRLAGRSGVRCWWCSGAAQVAGLSREISQPCWWAHGRPRRSWWLRQAQDPTGRSRPAELAAVGVVIGVLGTWGGAVEHDRTAAPAEVTRQDEAAGPRPRDPVPTTADLSAQGGDGTFGHRRGRGWVMPSARRACADRGKTVARYPPGLGRPGAAPAGCPGSGQEHRSSSADCLRSETPGSAGVEDAAVRPRVSKASSGGTPAIVTHDTPTNTDAAGAGDEAGRVLGGAVRTTRGAGPAVATTGRSRRPPSCR